MGEIADDYDYDRYDEDFYDVEPKTCYRCGAGGLYWKETPNGWRLAKNRELHVCASPDVTNLFDVIEEEN